MDPTKAVLAFLLIAMLPPMAAAGDGLVALQTGAPSCPDDSGKIYVDCNNGTVTDNRTGLIWLQNASCLSTLVDWPTAMEFTQGLSDIPAGSAGAGDDCGLSDGSSAGEWRLATPAEWQAMIDDADGDPPGVLDCNPAITNDTGTGCWTAGCDSAGFCAFSNLAPSVIYWSSLTWTADPTRAWLVFMDGAVGTGGKTANSYRVWPVRGGQ